MYNISKLILKKDSTLVFSTTTTINIIKELNGEDNVSILPGANTIFDDITINFQGKKADNGDKGIKPIKFGKNSFLNFKLLAPTAKVSLGKQSTLRGQIVAKKINVGKGSILSREEVFVKESDPEKVVIDTDGSVFLVNEIMVNFVDGATFSDALEIADFVGGRIIGFIEIAETFQIEVTTNTIEELNSKIQALRALGNPLIEEVFRNYVLQLE